jgi:hypothetical protein
MNLYYLPFGPLLTKDYSEAENNHNADPVPVCYCV